MSKEVNWDLFLNYFDGNVSVEDKTELDQWLQYDKANVKTFDFLQKIWITPDAALPRPDVKRAFESVNDRLEISEIQEDKSLKNVFNLWDQVSIKTLDRRGFGFRLIQTAAVILIVSCLYFLSGTWFAENSVHEVFVEKTRLRNITLNDGTQVILDSGSRLTYSRKFNMDSRTVTLDGEGYFNVKSDPQKPFIINTGNATLTVIGTKFNIRSWIWNDNVVVAVEEGKVSLRSNKNRGNLAEKILKKGQMSTIIGDGVPGEPETTDIDRHLSWMHRERYFENVPLEEILFHLERWYNLSFTLPDSSYRKKHVSMYIENKPVEYIIEIIAAMYDFQYKIEGKHVTFWS